MNHFGTDILQFPIEPSRSKDSLRNDFLPLILVVSTCCGQCFPFNSMLSDIHHNTYEKYNVYLKNTKSFQPQKLEDRNMEVKKCK